MASETFLWGILPVVKSRETFLWGIFPQFPTASPEPTTTSDLVGHTFSVPPAPSIIGRLPEEDRERLYEEELPEPQEERQIFVEQAEQQEEVAISAKQQLEDTIQNLKDFIGAAEEMQMVLADKLKNRRVRVDPRKNPAVREAIRRLFGVDSDTITYDMFKQALELRSKIAEEGRKKTYEPSSGS